MIGADGQQLLEAIDRAVDKSWLQQVPAVALLRRVWAEQYLAETGILRWREVKEIPTPPEMISSPYDPEARYSSKRSVDWVGYKVHLTETCDPDTPHMIVHVETTPAAVSDEVMVPVIHAALAKAGRLPSEHLVDAGYAHAPVLLESLRTYGVTVIGPVADDPSWQARSGQGLTKADFLVDWERQVVTSSDRQWARLPDQARSLLPWAEAFFREMSCRDSGDPAIPIQCYVAALEATLRCAVSPIMRTELGTVRHALEHAGFDNAERPTSMLRCGPPVRAISIKVVRPAGRWVGV